MLLLIAFGILILTPAAMQISHWIAPKFILHWPIAIIGSLSAWILALLSRSQVSQTVLLMDWQKTLKIPSIELLVDSISWPFAVVVATVTLSVLLTAVSRQREVENWSSWGSSLAIGAFGLLAVLAGNPISLLMAWAALDLIELVILTSQENSSVVRRHVIFNLAFRQLGSVVLLGAVVTCVAAGTPLSFSDIPQKFNILILFAAGLHLGIFPIQPAILRNSTLQRGLGTNLRLLSTASSFVLLSRSAFIGISPGLAPYLLILAALISFLSSISWLTSEDEISGMPFWILGCNALIIISTIRGQPSASLSWGIACLLIGGNLLLYGVRHRILVILPIISLICFTGLPFLPTWSGLNLYIPDSHSQVKFLDWVVNPIAFLSHLVLLAGYMRHTTRPANTQAGPERWIWFIYPLGLTFLPIILIYISFFFMPSINSIPFWQWILGAVSTILTILLWYFIYRREQPSAQPEISSNSTLRGSAIYGELLSLRWLKQIIISPIRSIEFILNVISDILEGQAGILWTFVFLAFLFFLVLPVITGK